MLKTVAAVLVAGSLAFAAQSASADSEQFWNGKHYQGVADLPFQSIDSGTEMRGASTMRDAPQGDSGRMQVSPTRERTAPAPYDTPGGYFG